MRRCLLGLVIGVVGLAFGLAATASAATAGQSLAAAAQLVPSDAGESFLSTQVAGGYVFATAPLATGLAGYQQGAVFVFAPQGSAPGASLHEVAELTPGAGSDSSLFGESLAVSADGSEVFVGNGISSSKPVYAFSMPAGGWSGTLTPSAQLVADPGFASGFGASLAVDGQTVVAGAPGSSAAYVFLRPAGGWAGTITPAGRLMSTSPDAIGGDAVEFGTTVEVSGDTVLVGDIHEGVIGKSPGFADVYVEPAAGWHDMTESAKLVPGSGNALLPAPSGGANTALSGDTIAIRGDVGSRALTGAGAVLVFTRPASGWAGTITPTATLAASDGSGLTAPIIGTDTIFASGESGEQVFSEPAGGWAGDVSTTATLSAPGAVNFPGPTPGLPLPISVSGNELLAGGSLSGTLAASLQPAYLFVEPAGGWSGAQTETAQLTVPTMPSGPAGQAPQAAAFSEPPDGWVSSSPSALLIPSGNPQQVVFGAVAVSGPTVVATPGYNAQDELPAQGPTDVFSEGSNGWQTTTESATISDSAGAALGNAGVAGPTIVAPAGGHLDVFSEPQGGWAGALHENATLSDAAGNQLSNAQISGTTIVSGRDVFSEPVTGWNGARPQTAQLSVPAAVPVVRAEAISGTTIVLVCANAHGTHTRVELYRRPAAGWQGTVSPTAVLQPQTDHTDGDLIAIASRDVAVLSDGTGDGSRTDIAVYVEPHDGWSGQREPTAVTSAGSTGGYEISEVSSSLAIDHGLIATNPVTEDHYMNVSGDLTIDPPPVRGWGHGPVPAPTTVSSGTGTVALSDSEVFGSGDGVSVSTLTGSGQPAVSALTLTQLAGRPRLALTVARGINAPGIRAATLQLPAGLQLAKTHRGIIVTGTRNPQITNRAHQLTLTLRRPATQITIKLNAPALKGVVRSSKPLTAQLHVTDAAGATTKLAIPAR